MQKTINRRNSLKFGLASLVLPSLAACVAFPSQRHDSPQGILYDTNASDDLIGYHFGDHDFNSFASITKIDGRELLWIYAAGAPMRIGIQTVDEKEVFPWVALERSQLYTDIDPEEETFTYGGDFLIFKKEPTNKILTTGRRTRRQQMPRGAHVATLGEDLFHVPVINFAQEGYEMIGYGTDINTREIILVDDMIVRVNNEMGDRIGGIIQYWSKTGKVYREHRGTVDLGRALRKGDFDTNVKVEQYAP